jgi:uncharacterized hydrophobic protein (TIGR00271 family)
MLFQLKNQYRANPPVRQGFISQHIITYLELDTTIILMLNKYLRFLDLKSDIEDHDVIHKTIRNGIIFKGTNLWILVFAIIIASVGLNTNSTAVIIGAMLISPLMGPINGMGYSIATYDLLLFRRAVKNFVFAVIASLLASTAYFSISPISTAHSELLARTSPTIYDVLIALFGGLAGIVGITSKHKGNIIPGVAIATALMPPLCTAGFGLATAQFEYFFGALYLFTINTVFIGISSVLFSQFVDFPIRKDVDSARKKNINRWISAVSLLTIIPSIYFGYLLVQKDRFSARAGNLISSIGVVEGSYLLKHEIDPQKRLIKLIYGGDSLSERTKQQIREAALLEGLAAAEIEFEQGFSFTSVNEDIKAIDNTIQLELNRLSAQINKAKVERDSVGNYYALGPALLAEAKVLYPQVTSLTLGQSVRYSQSADSTGIKVDSVDVPLVIISMNTRQLKRKDQLKLEHWAKTRLSKYKVEVQIQEISH